MKVKKIIFIISFLLILISLGMYLFFIINTDKIYKNIYVKGIDIGEMTKKEAYDKIAEEFSFGVLSLNYNGKKWEINLQESGFSYDIESAVNQAFEIGRNKDIFQNIIKIISINNFNQKEEVDLDYNHNYKKIEEFCNNVGKKLNTNPINASIKVQNDNIIIKAGKDGKKLNSQKIISELKERIENKREKNIDIKIPFDTSSPNIKYKDISQINGLISSFQTKYPISDVTRAWNVELSARKIDNQLLMPNEEVSFLNTIGDISYKEGFKNAKVIMNNEFRDGIGGGVCQVSSTLYNALLEGNLEIKERSNHTFPVRYVPVGRDATIADSSPDLKYKNNYSFPIFIRNYAKNGVMTTKIYGDTTKFKKVQIYSNIVSYNYPNVIYKKDPSIEKGKQIVEDNGQIGHNSITYKIEDGKKVIISQDIYRSKPRIVRVGTKEI